MKRINTRIKGLRSQRRLKDLLESQGYKVWFIHHTRWSKDIWNLWDGIALKDGHTFYIQCKTNTTGLVKKTDLHDKFCKKYKICGFVYNWLEKKKEWQIIKYDYSNE